MTELMAITADRATGRLLSIRKASDWLKYGKDGLEHGDCFISEGGDTMLLYALASMEVVELGPMLSAAASLAKENRSFFRVTDRIIALQTTA